MLKKKFTLRNYLVPIDGSIMTIFKPNCTYCHKRLQKNDSTIAFGRSNIWHKNCYREHLEKNYQNVWLREITLLKKVKKSLNRVRNQILSVNSRELDFSKFSKDFDINIISLKSITDTCKGLNSIQKDGLVKSLEKHFKKMVKLLKSYKQLLKQYSSPKTELTLEQFKENNENVLETLRKQWIELADNLMDIHNSLKSSEKKTQSKIRKEIQKQIEEIPNRVKKF